MILLKYFEICTETHFVSLLFLNERNITTSLLMDSKAIAREKNCPWIIGPQIIALHTIAPEENCLPKNCSRTITLEENCSPEI